MLRREARIGQLLNTSILTGCVTWFSMLLTPDSPLNSWGSQVPGPGWHFLWIQKPQDEPVLLWVWPEVGGDSVLEPRQLLLGCVIEAVLNPWPQPGESQDGRWYEEKMWKWQWQVPPLNQRPGRQAGWSHLGWPSYWDQPYNSQLCSFRKLLWLSVLDSKWDCHED